MKLIIQAAAFVLLALSHAPAHNNLFFPGDAFFSSTFGPGFLAGESLEEGLGLTYERHVGTTAKCGYAGYEHLLVKNVSPRFSANLLTVCELLFPAGTVKASPLPLFVYNRGFPLGSPFGIKYNEHWQQIQVGEAGLPYAIYDELGGADFIIDDWASAKDIAPLAIADGRAPMVKPDGETGVVEKPLEIDASKVMVVILSGGEGEVHRFAQRQEGLVFFVVTERLQRYRFDRLGVAMPQPVRTPLDDMFSKRQKVASDQVSLRAALQVYELNFGKLPTKDQGLAPLVEKPAGAVVPGWMPLLKKLPLDPWGKGYQWDGDVLFSLGADGIESEDDVVEPFELTEDGMLVRPAAADG
ncbi:MAG: type II secretion system protein G [Pseudoalteromonas tetraodonis]